jgi:hypothetical protein
MTARSSLVVSNIPGGMTILQDLLQHPGNVFFVNSVTGTDSVGSGTSPDKPCKTINYAAALCTASQGDTVVVMPGHAETISTATAFNLLIAGIKILGLGEGRLRPTISLGALTTAILTITGANITLENLRIVSALLNVAVGLNAVAGASGLTIRRCEIRDGSSILTTLIPIQIADTVTDVTIEDNDFISLGAAATQAILFAGASANSKVRRCRIKGTYTTAAIDGQATANTYIEIEDNTILQLDSAAGLAVKLHASTVGIIKGNRIFGGKDNTAPVIAAACLSADNFGTTDRLEGAVQLPMTGGLETWA